MEGGVCDRESCARKGSSEGAHVGEGLETPSVQRVWEGAQLESNLWGRAV